MEARETRHGIVAVVGDGNAKPGTPKYTLAEDIGEELVSAGFRVLTGGLGGVMEAASKGAKRSGRYITGDVVALVPALDRDSANQHADIVLPTGMGHMRNCLVAYADALIAVGGGAGTLSEIAQAWLANRLVVAMRIDGWSGKLSDRPLDDRVRFTNLREDMVFGANQPREAALLVRELLPRYRAGNELAAEDLRPLRRRTNISQDLR
ncbi:MAG: acyl-CoA synthetase [Candidatus Sumerlaeia bacterium]|nr:acyl-CoA synthetase [Candidatus Sumerlaeia bacterium]